MAKAKRLPKRVFGIRIPKPIRKGPLGAALASPAGQLVVAFLIYEIATSLAARASPERRDSRHRREWWEDSILPILARHPAAAFDLGRWKARKSGRQFLAAIRETGEAAVHRLLPEHEEVASSHGERRARRKGRREA
jgi:hypothetical protein